MLDKKQITDVFFDLDHTLWDFEKNSALTFERIFDKLNIYLNLDDFLKVYNGINHQYWKMYREDKISQEELRSLRLIKTFQAIDFDFDPIKIDLISDLYILNLSSFSNLFEGAISLLKELQVRYQLHVITNGFERIFDKLNINLNLDDFLKVYNGINHQYWKMYREDKISQEELRSLRLIKTFQAIDFDFDPIKIDLISDLYILNLSSFSNLFEGAISLLKELQVRYQLHVITNGFEVVQHHKINNSGLNSYFEKIFTAEKVGYKKPHPIIFKHALNQTNTLPKNSIMIGDSLEADILGALNIGMHAIHFNSHNEPQHNHCPMVLNLHQIRGII